MRYLVLPVIVLACLLFAAPAAVAGDDETEDSAAAQAFREAWWSETGAGALDRALEGYLKAAAAEGSAAVRARAVYRAALVLQRMGRTEEAVRALERLAKDFGGQSLLLSRARERLEEWTAEDLRESFSDWYKRYQYSAAFQAKIVDLVLKLGMAGDDGVAAKGELLTIGAPALPALREHADSANERLRRTVVGLIIELGELPPPAALYATSRWQYDQNAWRLILTADAPQRAALTQAAREHPDDVRSVWILAMLEGPGGMLRAVGTCKEHESNRLSPFLHAYLLSEAGPGIAAPLRAMVRDASAPVRVRMALAALLATGFTPDQPQRLGVTEDDLIAWAGSEHRTLREVAWAHMRPASVSSERAWKVAAARMRALPPRDGEQGSVGAALFGCLRVQPADTDVSLASDALAHVLGGTAASQLDWYPLGNWGPSGRGSPELGMRALAGAIMQARGQYARTAPGPWWNASARDAAAREVLFAWAAGAADPLVRVEAIQRACHALDSGVDRLVAVLAGDEAKRLLGAGVFQGLRHHEKLEALDWDDESLAVLVETAARSGTVLPGGPRSAVDQRAGRTVSLTTPFASLGADRVFFRLLGDERTRELLFASAIAAPERYPEHVFGLLGEGWSQSEANRRRGLAVLQAGWDAWAPAQRAPGLRLFLAAPVVRREDPQLDALVRTFLASGKADSVTRGLLLARLSGLSLADVRAAFDLAKPAEVDAATGLLRRLPAEEAVYDAFIGALRPAGEYFERMTTRFSSGPESRVQDLLRRLLEHNDPGAANHAVDLLKQRDQVTDLPLWIRALEHSEADVRAEAAVRLGRLYDAAAIKALARTVDDPHPEVRDAALASLARIEKTEQEKDRWRAYAKDR